MLQDKLTEMAVAETYLTKKNKKKRGTMNTSGVAIGSMYQYRYAPALQSATLCTQ